MNINYFMDLAKKEAKKAYLLNEIPVGAILVDNTTNLIISSAHNEIIKQKNSTKHAEMILIEKACKKLGSKHAEHIAAYGADNEQRLTGLHETCSMDEFRYGVSDRGASIRIPMGTANDGYGYLEDRRPSANMDPYIVCSMLIETICEEKLVEA